VDEVFASSGMYEALDQGCNGILTVDDFATCLYRWWDVLCEAIVAGCSFADIFCKPSVLVPIEAKGGRGHQSELPPIAEDFKKMWAKFDQEGKGYITLADVLRGVQRHAGNIDAKVDQSSIDEAEAAELRQLHTQLQSNSTASDAGRIARLKLTVHNLRHRLSRGIATLSESSGFHGLGGWGTIGMHFGTS